MFKVLSVQDYKLLLNRQLQLVNQNIDLTKDLDMKDYQISKLEKEVLELKQLLLKTSAQATNKQTNKITLERIKIYV